MKTKQNTCYKQLYRLAGNKHIFQFSTVMTEESMETFAQLICPEWEIHLINQSPGVLYATLEVCISSGKSTDEQQEESNQGESG